MIRHAHRDTTNRALDNGLSEKGKKQAENLRSFYEKRIKDDSALKDAHFISSPKKRCIETLAPLAELQRKTVEIKLELDEQRAAEKFEAFDLRIQRFAQWWVKESPEVLFASSHGDLLPLISYHLLGASIDFKKGAWLELEWAAGHAHLLWYVRNFKFFC